MQKNIVFLNLGVSPNISGYYKEKIIRQKHSLHLVWIVQNSYRAVEITLNLATTGSRQWVLPTQSVTEIKDSANFLFD